MCNHGSSGINANAKTSSNRINHCISGNQIVLCDSVIYRKDSDSCRPYCTSKSIALYDDSPSVIHFYLQVFNRVIQDLNVLAWRSPLPKR
jgi:hypothetical protein